MTHVNSLADLAFSDDTRALNPDVLPPAFDPRREKVSKYRNVRTQIDGRRFDSKAEANRYSELCLLQRAGVISDLECQPRYVVGTGKRPPVYVGDFAYIESGRLIVEDVKGVQTPVFRLKAKLFRERYPDIELRIIER